MGPGLWFSVWSGGHDVGFLFTGLSEAMLVRSYGITFAPAGAPSDHQIEPLP